MNVFNLPDLGEGLPEAEIHEWFVTIGEEVALDQPLVAMETAKALVEIPSPQAGKVAEIFGQSGDIIKTGAPLIRFVSAAGLTEPQKIDKSSVVGTLDTAVLTAPDSEVLNFPSFQRIKVTPKVRLLAKKLKVPLETVVATGVNGFISQEDVENAAKHLANDKLKGSPDFEPLTAIQRAMSHNIAKAQEKIKAVHIFDEAKIHHWQQPDITVRLIQAVVFACASEPNLNAWFDSESLAIKRFQRVHLGLAIDSLEGLFVPVIHDCQHYSPEKIREKIDHFKQQVTNKTLGASSLQGASIILSNIGKFAGRFATPVVIPPMTAIVAAGRVYLAPAVTLGNIVNHPILPLSLSFDHRVVTGGEASRFLKAMIEHLER